MTIQSGSSSPFQGGSNDQTSSTPQEFSFRTMQDDLLALQKKDTASTDKPSESPIKTQQPSSSAQIKPAPTVSTPQTKDFAAKPNPFLDQATTPSTPNKEVPLPEKNITQETKIIEVPTAETNYSHPNNSARKIIIFVIIILAIGIVSLGGYYFWLTQSPEQTQEVALPVVETPASVEEPVVITPPVEKYSATKPNYLAIDLATLSTTEIQASISAAANDIKDLPAQAPYEFIVVDANNNPIAFPIFATAAKLNFTPTLLSTLGETFSLFIYNDNGNIRLALSMETNNVAVLAKELPQQEKTFTADASLLFLGEAPEIMTGTFNTGSYNNFSIRYLNLNAQENLSIDYTVTDSQLVIGTSKNTLRATLNKLRLSTTSTTIGRTDDGTPADKSSITITPGDGPSLAQADFEDKFRVCAPGSKYTNKNDDSSVVYEETIIGIQENYCAIKWIGIKMENSPEMTCLYDHTNKNESPLGIPAAAFVSEEKFDTLCSGPLKAIMVKALSGEASF